MFTQWLYAILLSGNKPCLVVRCWTKQCFENCALLGCYAATMQFSETSRGKPKFTQNNVFWTISILIIRYPSFVLIKYVQWDIIINHSWSVSIVCSAVIFQIHLMLCIEQILVSVVWVLWKSLCSIVVPRGGGFGVLNPSPKFWRPSKIMPNSTRFWKLLKIAEFRMPTHQHVWKKGSKILKLPSVHNCFTLAVTNKLVVIIIVLKYQKLRKFYYMKWNYLYQIASAPRTPD